MAAHDLEAAHVALDAVYLLVLMLCVVGTHAVYLWQPMCLFVDTLVGIHAVYLLVPILGGVGPHAVNLWLAMTVV